MITGTQLVFGILGVLGIYSMFRALVYYVRAKSQRGGWINLPGPDDYGAVIAFGCGCVDLLLASLMFAEQSTHLFVIGCIVLAVCVARTIFGTTFLLRGKL